MIELAQHIEALLLENDCVIVPGLGGFVAHYAPATRVEEENIFLPPTRIIGFNPQLKMNDGLLVQSYMSVYGTNFSDATKIVEREVDELIAALHEEGKVDLPNVGEVRYTIYDTFDFAPYDNKITTPYLYGLDAFEMQELSALEKPKTEKDTFSLVPATTPKEKRTFAVRFNRAYLTNAAAVAAVIILSFFFSTPIENTEVIEENYATLLPDELFEKIEKQSLAITPIVLKQNTPARKTANKQTGTQKKVVAPVAVREVKVAKEPTVSTETKAKEQASHSVATTTDAPKQNVQPAAAKPVVAAPKRPYHIIIASVGTEKDAEAMAAQLVAKGFSGAKAIVGDGKMRVSIESCGTEVEAYQALARIRENETYKNAWVLKK
ncbi:MULTISPECIES: HU domain-containing protein [Bacteroides]|jgi:cell division protein FtsN|uniref:SPOR domain-containing protein n=1 Tax=Bacteroides intestinalis TaxID=329854 RepID=A0AAQ0RTV2_9BACE|nr:MULTISPECIES: SPOR domain-containing protein [Bacteroides]QDO70354.1 SPOR domain-containing protein [Bacteroides intestinalis]RGT55700.1 SPOR domain-containing protein [Bacteroides intestinalis]RHI11650.1 SPOR domain-containing protein [Bacteroides sp. AM16-24]RHN10511.1 SPOR domain-containing protein [Bacteroides intestinalis]UCB34541.1 SPOR domain-containing protein [Bacteroides intestinalis]